MTYEKNSYVYINSAKDEAGGGSEAGGEESTDMMPLEDAATIRMRGGDIDDPFDLPRQGGPRVGSGSAIGGGHMQHQASSSAQAASNYRSHIVRLNSIEPNTVMFSTKDYPILSDVSVPEIIDELEKQFDDKLCDLQGVRLVGNNVYICLSRKDSLNYLSTYGFYVRGVPVKVVDITHDSVVICLTGVPHYITDSTVTMLVSTFGIAIGEVERRFYKGIDTGERYVRLKPRAHTQVPDFVTVGGCKILIRVLSNEEVCPPYTLHSQVREKQGPDLPPPPPLTTSFHDHQAFNSQTTASFANSSIVQTSSSTMGAGLLSSFRAKPGHCNGTLNSPTSPAALPQLQTMSPVPRATDLLLTGITSATDNSDNVVSPKIAKSFRSRITLGLRSPNRDNDKSNGRDEVDDRTYVPGDPINDIPSLSPPPYKGPGSTGGSSTTSNSGRGLTGGLGLLSRITNRGGGGGGSSNGGDQDDYKTNTLGRKLNRHISKTDSSNSLASHKNEGANGKASCNGNGKRSSVVFEEPLKTTTTTSHSSTSTAPPPPSAHRVATATNRTVNGILRKGSVPGDDIVGPPPHEKEKDVTKQRKPLMMSSKKDPPPPKKKSPKLESVTESGMEDGDSTTTTKDTTKDGKDRSSRSRSSSSKTSSSKADKAAKDLALTRDLPWCGCWGNGCL